MRAMLVALLLSLSPAFAAGSPVLDDMRPPAAALMDQRVEIDWFQRQSAEVQRRWVEKIGTLPAPMTQTPDGSRARVDVRIDDKGRVVAARLGHSTGNASLDQELLLTLEDTTLAPPPATLPDEAGFVRFSVYFDVTPGAKPAEESTDAA